MSFWLPFPYSSRQMVKLSPINKFRFHFNYLFIWCPVHILLCDNTGHLSKKGFELDIQAHLQSSQRCCDESFTSLVSRVNQKQGSGEAAITAPKFISRCQEYTVQNKYTLHFFAALRGLGKNKKLEKRAIATATELHSTLALDTHILNSYSGGIYSCKVSHIFAYTTLTQ